MKMASSNPAAVPAAEGAATVEQRRERELIRQVQNGDNDKFYELIRPYERRIFAAAVSILRNEADAEEVAQEAFIKAFRHIRQFREEARFSTWLTQIVVNEALMRRRRDHSQVLEPIEGQQDEDGEYRPRDFADWREIPSESLERKEIRSALRQALASLAQKYREVFVLRDVEKMSIQETAKALGISQAAVKTRLLRARLMLRDLLAPGREGGWFSRLPFEKGNKPW